MAFKKVATSLFITTIVMLVSIEVAQAHEVPRKFGYGYDHEQKHEHEHHESEHVHIVLHAPHEAAHPHPQHHHVGDEHVHTAAEHDPEPPAHPHLPEYHPVEGDELLYGVSHPQDVGQAHEFESEKAYEECHQECMKNSFTSELSPTTAQAECQWTCKDTVIRNNHKEHHSASVKPPCGNSP